MTTRLPIPGQDDGQWGDILNSFLLTTHTSDGALKNGSITTAQLQDNSVSEAKLESSVQAKLNADPAASDATASIKGVIQLAGDLSGTADAPVIATSAIAKAKLAPAVQASLDKADSALQSAPVSSVNTRTGAVFVTKADVGLPNVDNTADTAKPISSATQAALSAKADSTSVVHLTGDESIQGIKSFSASPTVPSPTTPTQVANKSYVDTAIAGGVSSVAGKTGAVSLVETDIANLSIDLAAKVPINATYATDPGVPRIKVTNNYIIGVSTSNQMEIWTGATMTSWTNEWGGLRVRVPDTENWDAGLRVIAANAQSGRLLQVQNSARTVDLAYIDKDGTIASTVAVTAPNVGMPIKAAQPTQPDTTGWQAGWFWYDTSTEV